MTFETAAADLAFLLGRALFAAVLGFLALGNLLDLEASIGYARHKGAPAARVTVPLGSLVLLAGAVAVLLGAYPLTGALAVAGFLAAVTPVMHDFWALEGQDRENELIHFLKNVGLLGAALMVAALAGTPWPYAVGVGI